MEMSGKNEFNFTYICNMQRFNLSSQSDLANFLKICAKTKGKTLRIKTGNFLNQRQGHKSHGRATLKYSFSLKESQFLSLVLSSASH